MAPPVKRRKLSSTSSLEIHRDNCTEISDTSSRYTFTTSPRLDDAPTIQTSLPRVEEERPREVHPAVGGIEDFKVLLPRQGTVAVAADLSVSVSVAPTIAYQDASTTITYTPPATPSLPTLPSISGATTFSTTSTSISSTSTSAATTSNSTSNTTAETTSSSASRITSAPHSLTTSSIAFDTNSTRSSSKASNSVSADTFFIATLSDGDITTITRARTAFVTTFGDGEMFTIPGLSSTLSRSGTSSPTTTSDSEQSTISATALITGSNAASPGAYGTATSAPSSSTSSGSAPNNNHNSNSPPPAGTIAGGVVGGCAGLAVIVLIAMLFVRWYRRRSRSGHLALPPASSDSPEQTGDLSRGPGMAERAGLMPLAAAVPAMFRHHNRSTEPSESSERGFTRISGRKLPSAWSEGMSSPPPEMPLNAAATNTAGASASYYRDSQGQYGGDGTGFPPSSPTASPTSPASSHGPLRSSTHEMMIMPGAQRQAQLHSGGPYGFTAGPSGFQRSDTPSSLDPSRNSRFTEEM